MINTLIDCNVSHFAACIKWAERKRERNVQKKSCRGNSLGPCLSVPEVYGNGNRATILYIFPDYLTFEVPLNERAWLKKYDVSIIGA